MKDLSPQPLSPQRFLALPNELRLVRVRDDEAWDAADEDRRRLVRPRSVRRRLFVDDDEPSDEEGGAGGSGDRGPRRPRVEQPLGVFALQVQDAVDNMAAEETAAATRRWNFDFVNERPLEGQWQWEKVGDIESDEGEENGDPQPMAPLDDRHSPLR